MTRKIFFVFFCFSSLFAFAYNTFLYSLNFGVSLWGWEIVPRANLALMGVKEAIILGSGLLLLLFRKRAYLVSAILGLIGTYVLAGIEGVKTLYVPTLTVAIFYLESGVIKEFVLNRRRFLLGALGAVMAFCLLIGFGDLAFRSANGVDSDNWTNHQYLLANNQYRCAKMFLEPNVEPIELLRCVTTRLNFYKLKFVPPDEYVALQALFLPLGDSVVFATLIFYFLVFFLFSIQKSRGSTAGPHEALNSSGWIYDLSLSVLVISIFLTLNRVNSFFALFVFGAAILSRLCWVKKADRKWWRVALFVLPVLVYAYRSDYLVMSIFEAGTPSNLGHEIRVDERIEQGVEAPTVVKASRPAVVEEGGGVADVTRNAALVAQESLVSFKQALAKNMASIKYLIPLIPFGFLVMRKRYFYLAGYLVVLGIYWVAMVKFRAPLVLFANYTINLPMESDFLKALFFQGSLGVTVHALILGLIGGEMLYFLSKWRSIARDRVTMLKFALFAVMSLEFLGYQFIAPYFIAGYVVFASFWGLWFLMMIDLKHDLAVEGSLPR